MLSVLSVAYPFALLTRDPVGGAEQILAALDRAVVAAGGRSTVIAAAGSEVAGALIPVPAVAGEIDDLARARAHAAVRRALAAALARERFDLVHLHGVDFASYLPAPGVPALATLHLPLDWYPESALRPARPGTFLLPVSRAQAAAAPAGADLLEPIENGVDLEAFSGRHARRRFALALGRICPEKGFHLALDAARQADVPLLLAGEVFPYAAHRRYFEQEIRPRLDHGRRYLGPVTGARKRRLLAAARCLLVPSLAAETSSLVAREALAAGTPVIAFPSGALPEVIQHGVTGFLVGGGGDMAAAIARAENLDPEDCRRAARARFGLGRMTDAYLALYAAIARGRPARAVR